MYQRLINLNGLIIYEICPDGLQVKVTSVDCGVELNLNVAFPIAFAPDTVADLLEHVQPEIFILAKQDGFEAVAFTPSYVNVPLTVNVQASLSFES